MNFNTLINNILNENNITLASDGSRQAFQIFFESSYNPTTKKSEITHSEIQPLDDFSWLDNSSGPSELPREEGAALMYYGPNLVDAFQALSNNIYYCTGKYIPEQHMDYIQQHLGDYKGNWFAISDGDEETFSIGKEIDVAYHNTAMRADTPFKDFDF